MSRIENKKPVGFATHIIAGGIAGACEAVSPSFLLQDHMLNRPDCS